MNVLWGCVFLAPLLLMPATLLLGQDAAAKEPAELLRLRQRYDEQLEAATKPITAAYRQQLEDLQKALTQRNHLDAALAVRKEWESVTEPDESKSELKSVLLHYKWSWTSVAKERDVFMDFHEDGTVNHRGMHGAWTIIGSHELKLIEDGGRTFVLRFNPNFESYRSIAGPELHGVRKRKE